MAVSIVESQSADTRTIVGLIGFSVLFAIAGQQLAAVKGPQLLSASPSPNKLATTGGKTIIGGFAAATILSLLAHAGTPGREFAVGLAVITCVTSVLVYGSPVWEEVAALVGHPTKPATPTGNTTPTNPTS